MEANLSILVVDDIRTVRRILTNALSELGYTNITQAENGVEALEKLRQQTFQLVIVDWNMPKMSGIDLLKLMRADDTLTLVPFLMCTSRAHKDNVVEAMTLGASSYIIKPFNARMLGKTIDAIFKNQGF